MPKEEAQRNDKPLMPVSTGNPAPAPEEVEYEPLYPGIGEIGEWGPGEPSFQTLLGMPMLCVEGEPECELFCPRCRAPIRADPCRHVLFIYGPDDQAFTHVAPHAKAAVDMLLARIKESEDDDGQTDLDPIVELVKYWRSPSAFCLQISYEGIACGPVSDLIYIGVELCPPSELEPD